MMLNNKVMAMLKALSGGNSGGSGAPSDWNASEGEPGHVLNRTHYEEVGLVEVLPETRVVFENSNAQQLGMIPFDGAFVEGETYTVKWGGEEYSSKAGIYMGIVVLGNQGIMDDISYTDEPFLMMAAQGMLCIYAIDGSTEQTISIVTGQTVVKTLDPKFLPSSLQFGETVVGGDTLTWDGNTDGLVSVMGLFYKVSDAVLTMSELANGVVLRGRMFDGQEMEMNCTAEMLSGAHPVIMMPEAAGFFVAEDNASLDGGVFPEKGVYLPYAAGVSFFITVPGYTGFETKTVKPMDAKYLPDGVPYIAGGVVEVLPETTLTIESSAEGNIGITEPLDLELSGIYTVTWNGVDYKCITIDGALLGHPGEVFLSNKGGDFDAGTVVFLIASFGGIDAMDGSETVTLSIREGEETIKKMDSRCLPNVADIPAEWLAALKAALEV